MAHGLGKRYACCICLCDVAMSLEMDIYLHIKKIQKENLPPSFFSKGGSLRCDLLGVPPPTKAPSGDSSVDD